MKDPFAQDYEVEPLMDQYARGNGKGVLRRKEDQTSNHQVSLALRFACFQKGTTAQRTSIDSEHVIEIDALIHSRFTFFTRHDLKFSLVRATPMFLHRNLNLNHSNHKHMAVLVPPTPLEGSILMEMDLSSNHKSCMSE